MTGWVAPLLLRKETAEDQAELEIAWRDFGVVSQIVDQSQGRFGEGVELKVL